MRPCRSAAPGIVLPLSRIDVCKTEDVLMVSLDSFSENLNVQIPVQPEKADEPVAAENCGKRNMPTAFQPLLKMFIGSGRTRCVCAIAAMAVEVPEQPVFEL